MTAPATVTALDDGCDTGTATTATPNDLASVHTVPPRPHPVVYDVAVTPPTVCPGGHVRVAVRLRNASSTQQTVWPSLTISPPTRELDCCEEVTVPAEKTVTFEYDVRIPLDLPVGAKTLGFRDSAPGDGAARLEVSAPRGGS